MNHLDRATYSPFPTLNGDCRHHFTWHSAESRGKKERKKENKKRAKTNALFFSFLSRNKPWHGIFRVAAKASPLYPNEAGKHQWDGSGSGGIRQGLLRWPRWHFHPGVFFWAIVRLAILFLILPPLPFLILPTRTTTTTTIITTTPTRSSTPHWRQQNNRHHRATTKAWILFPVARSAWTTILGIPLHHSRSERMTIAGLPSTVSLATLPAAAKAATRENLTAGPTLVPTQTTTLWSHNTGRGSWV